MIALLASPLARWAAAGAVVASLAGWGALERAGRRAAVADAAMARAEAEALKVRIRHMETRRVEEDRAAREPDPVGRLRDEFSRPD